MPISRATVSFVANTERVGPLAAGQANIIRAIELSGDPAHLNLTTVFDVPAGVTLEQITDVIRKLLVRHESLRTTYRLGPDPVQKVLAAAELEVSVHEVDADVSCYAEELARQLRSGRFDLENELPLRAAVVTEREVPVHVAIVVCHSAADATTWELLVREWDELIAGRDHAPGSEPQPIDLVAVERRAPVQRLMTAALRYWESRLRVVPHAMFPVSELATAEPVFSGLRMRSKRAVSALAAVSERTGAAPSSIVLAAMALLVGRRSGRDACVITSLSANRVLPELRNFFGTLAQDSLMPLDLRQPASFDAVVAQVRTAALRAYRHSWFEPNALWQVINGVGHDRGIAFARDCVFNDMSSLVRRRATGGAGETGDGGAAEPARIQRYPGVRTQTADVRADIVDDELGAEFTWLRREWMATPFTLYAHQIETELELALWASPHILSRTEAVEFGRSMLRIIIQAAEGDIELTRLAPLVDVEPLTRGKDRYEVDSCSIELAAVQGLVEQALVDKPCLVVAVPDEQLGHRLVCYLADADAEHSPQRASPEEIHAACMAASSGRVTAMAPHTYVICAQAPAELGNVEAWRRQRVLVEGSGRPATLPVAGQLASVG